MIDDVDLCLTHSHRLDVHLLAPGRIEQQRGLQGRLGQAAERATIGHRADEHALVQEMLREADPISQQRTLGER